MKKFVYIFTILVGIILLGVILWPAKVKKDSQAGLLARVCKTQTCKEVTIREKLSDSQFISLIDQLRPYEPTFLKIREPQRIPEEIRVLDSLHFIELQRPGMEIPESITELPQLEKFVLTETADKIIQRYIDLPHLQQLVFEVFLHPDDFEGEILRLLYELDFTQMQASELNIRLFIDPTVHDFTAYHKQLYMNQSLNQAPQLKSLIISAHDFVSFSLIADITDISKLEKLVLLNLDDNQFGLESLPEDIGNLTGLKQLNVGYNQLTSLPDSFTDLQQLESFTANYNRFREIPSQLFVLPELSYVAMNHNPIQTLNNQIVVTAPNMEKIELNNICVTEQGIETWLHSFGPDATVRVSANADSNEYALYLCAE